MKTFAILGLGFVFGSILIAAQAFHWIRIQEMFHFDSFHMYGILLSAIATGVISLWLIKKYKLKSSMGNAINVVPKPRRKFGNIFGGLLFGTGWALTGACTAPLFILLGYSWQIGMVSVIGAFLGVLLYALVKSKLPE